MSKKFEESLKEGTHRNLQELAGTWKGITRVWFEPGVLADESPCEGTMRSVLGGRFLLHEYKSELQGKPIEGIAIFGHSLGDNKLQCAWVDSFHNGTAIMFSENTSPDNPYSVRGHYAGDPPWGWDTVLRMNGPDKLTITMYNIPPGGTGDKAVETVYERVK